MTNTNNIFGYFDSRAIKRDGAGKCLPSDIATTLYTHLIYAHVNLEPSGKVTCSDPSAMAEFVKLKEKNPKLKMLVSMGGWDDISENYSVVAKDPSLRSTLVSNIVTFVRKNEFDGFDLDWQYPGTDRGGSLEDKANYVVLLKDLNKALKHEELIFTISVGTTPLHVSQSYDVPNISTHVDYILMKTYDMHGFWDSEPNKVVGQNSPLYASSKESSFYSKHNVDAIIFNWMDQGAPLSKLVLGIPMYGRSFTLTKATKNYLGAPFSGPGKAGPYYKVAGYMTYTEICSTIKEDGWTEKWDDDQKVPYAFKGDQWIGYDNRRSVAAKAEFAKNKGLGGVMIWSIDQDDVHGNYCDENEKFPLVNAIHSALFPPNIFGYYGFWAAQRTAPGNCDVKDIDPTLFTHLIYAFVRLEPTGKIEFMDKSNDPEKVDGFANLKKRNPKLKVLVSMKERKESSAFSTLAKEEESRDTLVTDIVNFVRKYGFDGFDLDWDYPGKKGGSPQDKAHYVALLKALYTKFEQEHLLFTIVVGATKADISIAYNIKNISKYVHFILLRTYDLHNHKNEKTGLNAPLYGTGRADASAKINLKSIVNNWIKEGAPASKLILGIPSHGQTFTLADETENFLGAPTSGPGNAGMYSNVEGCMMYSEICSLKENGWTEKWDDDQKVPYAFKGDQWISYDDPPSVKLKAKFAKNKGLGGVMIWSIDQDVVHGKPSDRLVNAIHSTLFPRSDGHGKNSDGFLKTLKSKFRR